MTVIDDWTADWPQPGRPEDRAEYAMAKTLQAFVKEHGSDLSQWLRNARDEYEAEIARVYVAFEAEKADRRLRDALDAKAGTGDGAVLDAIRKRVAS